jgi:hypothetical protein
MNSSSARCTTSDGTNNHNALRHLLVGSFIVRFLFSFLFAFLFCSFVSFIEEQSRERKTEGENSVDVDESARRTCFYHTKESKGGTTKNLKQEKER